MTEPKYYDDPTPEDLELPGDPLKLYALQATFEAPRAAWRAYYAATGQLDDEANTRQRAREVRCGLARAAGRPAAAGRARNFSFSKRAGA